MDIVGSDFTTASLQILNEGASIELWNETLVTLILKVKDLMIMSEFRPISLCNVSYEFVCRALTNRLRPVLSKIVGPFDYG